MMGAGAAEATEQMIAKLEHFKSIIDMVTIYISDIAYPF